MDKDRDNAGVNVKSGFLSFHGSVARIDKQAAVVMSASICGSMCNVGISRSTYGSDLLSHSECQLMVLFKLSFSQVRVIPVRRSVALCLWNEK